MCPGNKIIIMFKYPDIDPDILKAGEEAEYALYDRFKLIDEISEANQYKVLSSFRKNKVDETHFNSASGYGYNETGRDVLERVYADIFHTEDALVRPHITCGTHAIYLAMRANLVPGDEILFISGKPYDSLYKSVGITESPGSLAEMGVRYKIVDLINNCDFDYDSIKDALNNKTKMIHIQRSKGYSTRKSLSVDKIGSVINYIKDISSDIIINVDNCYGEFVELYEPADMGCDLMEGSLIKNPGGGLAPCGGYIAGRADLVERCAYFLTAPGLGKEVGTTLGTLKPFFQGLSQAPKVTAEAVKNAYFAAYLFENKGYKAYPSWKDDHHCIVEAVELGSKEKLLSFCSAIQSSSYVDSYVTPLDWEMPGYDCNVVMASGAFMSGSSIELSADGPMRAPYVVYFQGGLTHEHGKYALLSALQKINN